MKKLLCMIIIFLVIILFLTRYCFKAHVSMILPHKILCSFHENIAENRKNSITNVIENIFPVVKDPEKIAEIISKDFVEVQSVEVQICQSDKICFYVDASKPVFILNNCFVVCSNGVKVLRDFFAQSVLEKIAMVSTTQSEKFENIIHFVEQLSPEIIDTCIISWQTDNDILFYRKKNPNICLHSCSDMVISERDFILCQKIEEQLQAEKKNKKKNYEFDLRFKNQIIVR